MTGEQLELGSELKRTGLGLVEDNNGAFVACMRTIAKGISIRLGQVTSDDLRRAAESARLKPKHPNAWGSIFTERGWIVVGRQASTWASSHHREIKVWKWEG